MLEIQDTQTGMSAYVLFDVEEGTYTYAQEMVNDHPSWGDLCSGTAVIDVDTELLMFEETTIDSNHAPDKLVLETAYRALDGYRYQNNGGNNFIIREELELWEMVEKVAKRAGMHVYGVGYSGYETSVTSDLSSAEYLCITQPGEFSDYHGREFSAMCNGTRWSVYQGPLDRVNQWVADEWGTRGDFPYTDYSNDVCHGFTWENSDTSGASTPTTKELRECL